MRRSVLAMATVAVIVPAALVAAQNQPATPAPQSGPVQAQPQAPPQPMTFFVTSVGLDGGNLGGLAGADAHCQKLAAGSGQAGAASRTWRAYLSTQGSGAVNARDRIGTGPWANARGAVIARDLAHLHGDTVELAQLGSNLTRMTALTEQGTPVPGAGETPNKHDILTGSTTGGRAFPATEGDRTCNNWTSNGTDGRGQVGHSDRAGGGNVSWNSAHPSRGCSAANLQSTGGAGLLYCFAAM